MTDVQSFFTSSATSGGDRLSASAAFKSHGDIVSGTIAEEPSLVQQTEFGNDKLKYDSKGNPLMQLIVTLQTELRNWEGAIKPPTDEDGNPKPPSADIGLRTLWVKFKLRDAIGDALRKAEAKGLEVGGKLAVRYTADSTFNGFNVKEYQAKYAKPEKGAAFFAEATPATPAPAQSKAAASWDADTPPF